jgi:hypothetical protein
MIRYIFVVLIVVCVWTSGCSRHSPSATATLSPSGVNLTSIGPTHLPDGESALLMECETGMPIVDRQDARKELDKSWAAFLQENANRMGATNCLARISHRGGSGLFAHSQSYGFVFQKTADGQWHYLYDETK